MRSHRTAPLTKALFADELRARSEDVAGAAARTLADDSFVDELYRYTHTLKGVALTVGYADVHEIAEAVSDYKYRHEASPLPKDDLERLAERASALEIYRMS